MAISTDRRYPWRVAANSSDDPALIVMPRNWLALLDVVANVFRPGSWRYQRLPMNCDVKVDEVDKGGTDSR